MKTTSLIKLSETTTTTVRGGPNDGETIEVPKTRTVKAEIDRLRHMGAHDAANRMLASCDDSVYDQDEYLAVDPTTGKAFAFAEDAKTKAR